MHIVKLLIYLFKIYFIYILKKYAQIYEDILILDNKKKLFPFIEQLKIVKAGLKDLLNIR